MLISYAKIKNEEIAIKFIMVHLAPIYDIGVSQTRQIFF